MPERCVDKFSCGTHAPGWLSKSHPLVTEGVVDATVCFHWGSTCCFWSSQVKVRNCGGFYVYQLKQTPACSLRYCGNRQGRETITEKRYVQLTATIKPIEPQESVPFTGLTKIIAPTRWGSWQVIASN